MAGIQHRTVQRCPADHRFMWQPRRGLCPYCDLSQRARQGPYDDGEPCDPECCPPEGEQQMSERLTETAAQVAAEIPRFSWELMDEDQRDDLMRNVVLPRHGKTTSDGVTLTHQWWADTLGTTYSSVEQRLKRLRAKNRQDEGSSRSQPTRSQKSSIRSARAALREHPDLAGEVVKDPEVRESVRKALDKQYEDSPKPIQTDRPGDEPLELLTTFRRVHRDVDRIIGLIIEGRAVVSDAEREALIEEARWLRTASEHIESGLKAGSLEQSLRTFQEEYL